MKSIIRNLLLPVLFCSTISAVAQADLDETKMVGFACFSEGRETRLVSRFGKMLKRNRYTSIRGLLQSPNSAERLMAVLCLERLVVAGRVTISAEEKILIDQIKVSTEAVDVCTGCITQPGIALKNAFESQILWGATAWLDRHIE